ncbi:hypothetical protein EBQ90_10180, partial [bacterium]|nr:hypothetical protein [bacterium]
TASSGGSQLAANAQTGVSNDTYSVSLVSGVFSQTINLSAANFHTVFPDSTTGTWVQVQDMTAGTTYPRQQFTTVPYALKVPVDGTTVTYNASGQLQVSSIGSASLPATINATTVTGSTSMGIGTTSPDANDLSFGGGTAREVLVQRHPTSNTAGNSLSLIAGGATVGATNKNGGTLILSSGTSTGTGSSSIQFQTATAGTSGTTDRSVSTKMVITGAGNVGIGTTTPESFGSNAMFAVSNGSSYFFVADDFYTSAMFGPRKANDGFSTVLYSWSTNNSGNYWQQDASNDYLSWKQVLSGTSSQSIFHIKSSGNVGIGTTTPSERLKVVDDSANYTAAMAIKYPPSNASTTQNYVGQWSEVNTQNSAVGLNQIYGSVNRALVNTAGSKITGINGGVADVFVTANRPVANAIGMSTSIANTGPGTLDHAFSLLGSISNTTTGTITNGYGLYLGDIQATNKYGIYQADTSAKSYFGGNVGVGITNPAAKLDVAGEVKFGNTSSTCNATNEGQQRYNSTLKLMEFCNGTNWERVGARAVMPIIVTDEKPVNTQGGNITANTWTTRTLNTIKADPGSYVSLSSNQLTFAAGSYKCIISVPSFKAQFHQVRLFNVTSNAVHATGTQDHAEDTDWTGNRVFLHTYFQINSSTTFRVEHIVNYPAGAGTQSLGVESPWTTGTFTVVDCLRLGY